MRTEPSSYITSDEKQERRPIELYHFYDSNGNHFRFNSGDSSFEYESETYLPATLQRQPISYAENGVTSVSISAAINTNYLDEPLINYFTTNYINNVRVEIKKLFHDQDTQEAATIFSGFIRKTGYSSTTEVVLYCSSFEYYLEQKIPKDFYQPVCNNILFDSRCGLSKASYKVIASISSITNDIIITSSSFSSYADGYFARGFLEFGLEKRMIIAHKGNQITLRFPLYGLEVSDSIDVYPGCNLTRTTCKNRFNNILNFFGSPDIPIDNPVTWIR